MQEIKVTNEKGGQKNDGGKLDPTLLIASMPDAIEEVIKVLTAGAAEYGADNWKLVEPKRYDAAFLRHTLLGYFKGDRYDQKSGYDHLAHAICCLLFLLQMKYDADKTNEMQVRVRRIMMQDSIGKSIGVNE